MQDPTAGGPELIVLPLTALREPRQALRGPERLDPKYAELRDSIRAKGVLVPILVRPGDEPGTYTIIDGTQRAAISKETGKRTIPARVIAATEAEALEHQITANLKRVPTSPMQYAEQLRLMMVLNPTLTTPQLAVKLDVSPSWINGTLGLLNLDPEVAALVDAGKIPVANAKAMGRLPTKDQKDFAVMAQVQPPKEFVPKASEIGRRLREGARAGTARNFVHVDRFQSMTAVKAEIESGEVRKGLFAEYRPKDAAAAWKLALQWVLHRDPHSLRNSKSMEKAIHAEEAQKRAALDEEARRRRSGGF